MRNTVKTLSHYVYLKHVFLITYYIPGFFTAFAVRKKQFIYTWLEQVFHLPANMGDAFQDGAEEYSSKDKQMVK